MIILMLGVDCVLILIPNNTSIGENVLAKKINPLYCYAIFLSSNHKRVCSFCKKTSPRETSR